MINIVLYRPQMPQNAGNIIRLSANCGAKLHFVGPLDFFMDDKKMLRAGLDYHEIANLTVHTSFEKFMENVNPKRLIASTIHGTAAPSDFSFEDEDFLLFGRETSGLPNEVMQIIPEKFNDLAYHTEKMANSNCDRPPDMAGWHC